MSEAKVTKIKPVEETMVNGSGLRPRGRSVLVQPVALKTKYGLVLPDSVSERTLMVETKALVIEVGPAAWDDEKVPRAVPGEMVFISKYSGHMAIGPKDGQSYRLVNDRDIFCAVED